MKIQLHFQNGIDPIVCQAAASCRSGLYLVPTDATASEPAHTLSYTNFGVVSSFWQMRKIDFSIRFVEKRPNIEKVLIENHK